MQLLNQSDLIFTTNEQGTDANDILSASPNNNYSLNGHGGNDILLGSSSSDTLNPGSGDGYVLAGEGKDSVYIDSTLGGERTTINFADIDDATDRLFIGRDKYNLDEPMGTVFLSIQGWGVEDELVLRDFHAENYYYTIPTGTAMIMFIRSDDNLHKLIFEGIDYRPTVIIASDH